MLAQHRKNFDLNYLHKEIFRSLAAAFLPISKSFSCVLLLWWLCWQSTNHTHFCVHVNDRMTLKMLLRNNNDNNDSSSSINAKEEPSTTMSSLCLSDGGKIQNRSSRSSSSNMGSHLKSSVLFCHAKIRLKFVHFFSKWNYFISGSGRKTFARAFITA